MKYNQKPVDLVTKICETCGNEFLMPYGYSIIACWLVTGHNSVQGFMCSEAQGGQHWGCTPQHAVQALEACLNEHMNIDTLMAKHQEMANNNIPKIAPEHLPYIEEPDKEDFHIVRKNNGD